MGTKAGGFVQNTIGLTEEYRVSFTKAIASGVDTDLLNLVATGSGMAVAQTGGNLVITTGVNTNSETLIRSKAFFKDDFIARFQASLSQRIVNQVFSISLTDVLGDNLAITINSATSVTISLSGMTAGDVGKAFFIGGFTGTAGMIPGRYVIASATGTTVTLTVSGFPASGSGTCSAWGMNYHHVVYDGATATNAKYDTQRKGYNFGDSTITTNTTVAPGHIATITNINGTGGVFDELTTSQTSQELTQRGSRVLNIPTCECELYLQIRVTNGSTAPASTTTLTMGFLSIIGHDAPTVRIAGILPFSANQSLPVQILNNPSMTVISVTPGTGAANLGKAEDAAAASGDTGVAMFGVRVPTTPVAATSAAGDYGTIAVDQEGKSIVAPFAGSELGWQTNPVTLTTTASTALKAAAAAGVRNFLTDLTITNTSATGVKVDILDNATIIRTFWSPATSSQNYSFSMPLKGTAATAMNVQLGAAVTDVRVSANGYLGV